jgi:nitrogen-specific signal transduction histidine kinase
MREWPNKKSDNATSVPTPAPMLSHRWWIPSAFAILVLVLLLAVPAIVDRRIGKVRGELVLASESARVVVNDLEASFASQLLVRSSAMSPKDIPAFATRAKLDADNAELRTEVRRIGPDAMARYNELNNRLSAWDASAHDGTSPTAKQGLELLASAERLDSLLTTLAAERRVEVRRLERIDVLTPAILTPIALIAIIIVMWAGRRTLRLARVAEEERAHVVRASEARAALLRGVTHDVKNPLGAAAGYAELLEDDVVGPLPARHHEMVKRIHRLVQTAVQTISDLLELARTDGDLQIEYGTSDLAGIVNDVVVDHQGMAREHGVDVTVMAPPTPIVTDPVRVRQILANLVSNAIKYTPSGGHVRVSVVNSRRAPELGEVVGVEVRDTGSGIPPELHEKVFEEFFRVRDSGASLADGNGLGLAISRRIARLLGGDVTVSDADGGGAVFTLWLTSSAAPSDTRERARNARGPATLSSAQAKAKVI